MSSLKLVIFDLRQLLCGRRGLYTLLCWILIWTSVSSNLTINSTNPSGNSSSVISLNGTSTNITSIFANSTALSNGTSASGNSSLVTISVNSTSSNQTTTNTINGTSSTGNSSITVSLNGTTANLNLTTNNATISANQTSILNNTLNAFANSTGTNTTIRPNFNATSVNGTGFYPPTNQTANDSPVNINQTSPNNSTSNFIVTAGNGTTVTQVIGNSTINGTIVLSNITTNANTTSPSVNPANPNSTAALGVNSTGIATPPPPTSLTPLSNGTALPVTPLGQPTLPSVFFLGGNNATNPLNPVTQAGVTLVPVTSLPSVTNATVAPNPITSIPSAIPPTALSLVNNATVAPNGVSIAPSPGPVTSPPLSGATTVASTQSVSTTTQQSLVININIDLGRTSSTPPAASTVPVPTTLPPIAMSTFTAAVTTTNSTTTIASLAPNSTNSLRVSTTPLTSLTSPTPNSTTAIVFPVTSTTSSPISTVVAASPLPSSTLPTVGAGSINLSPGNGSQVVCFSLPLNLIERLLPLIQNLITGQGAIPTSSTFAPPTVPPVMTTSVTVPAPLNVTFLPPITIPPIQSTLAQSITVPPIQLPSIAPPVFTIPFYVTAPVPTSNPSTSATGTTINYPFLGPYGVGSYGGLRPPPDNYTITVPPRQIESTTRIRPLNPFPGAAGVIPYYTNPPYNPLPPATTPSIPLVIPTTTMKAIAAVQPPASNSGYFSGAVSANNYGVGYQNPPAPAAYSISQQPAGTPVIGMPGYAFSGSSSTDGLQAVVVQPQAQQTSWSSTSHQQGAASASAAGQPGPVWITATSQPALRQLTQLTEGQAALDARNALCGGPMTNLIPDAITVTQDGIMHVFVGGLVFGLREGQNGKQKPVWMGNISDKWPGVHSTIQQITGATTRQDGTTFLFSRDTYWKFDNNYQMAADSPKKVPNGFPGVAQFDSVYQAPQSNGDMNFLRGEKVFSYNHKRFPPSRGPTATTTLGLPAGLTVINAAYTDWKGSEMTFVSGQNMWRISAAGKIKSGFPQLFTSLFDC
ncbi:hypothetical protein BV898_11879 [Hypsibius exemplaris]|uniref:Uncharacterized protein n=1 Tax=Hypsibius exemplaris TaxID=2072580 RepID=A0A1W0WFC9_HYPEX|nr:hypothetical protein BV898_11879 [Hypsibius exemplaris]